MRALISQAGVIKISSQSGEDFASPLTQLLFSDILKTRLNREFN